MICPECGHASSDDATTCEACGAALPAPSTAMLIRRGEGQTFVLPAEAMIGRLESCQISVPDKSVSREHARVVRLGDRYVVRDLGSTNGTLVNGRRISGDVPLRPGDMVTVGSVEFLFEQQEPPLQEREEVPAMQEEETTLMVPESDDGGLDSLEREYPGEPSPAPAETITGQIMQAAEQIADLARALLEQESAAETGAATADELEASRATLDDVRSALGSIETDVSPETVGTAEQLLERLQGDPRDIEVLLDIGRHAAELAELVRGYDELRRTIQAIATAVAAQ
ncbi:MAG TPA: FHA domain-containing protein [Chloroflexota bacterium]|nr:FHA domain-containing protein [Chloroflexota bacterium]